MYKNMETLTLKMRIRRTQKVALRQYVGLHIEMSKQVFKDNVTGSNGVFLPV